MREGPTLYASQLRSGYNNELEGLYVVFLFVCEEVDSVLSSFPFSSMIGTETAGGQHVEVGKEDLGAQVERTLLTLLHELKIE